MSGDDSDGPATLAFKASLVDFAQQSIIVTDAAGTITYCNRYATVMYGWEAEQLIGQPSSVLVTDAMREQADAIMQALCAGKPWRGEFLVCRKDGSTFIARVLDIPMLDASGALVGIIGVSDDVTNIRRLESEARLATVHLQRALEVAKMAAWTWSLLTDELRWSKEVAKLIGVEPSRLPTTLADGIALLSPDQHALAWQFVARARAGESAFEHDFRVDSPAHGLRHIHIKATRQPDASGDFEVLGVMQDITARTLAEQSNRELRQQLEQVQKLESLGRLAGGIAHDINNLLAGVSLYAALLRDDPNLAPTQLTKLDAIFELCKRGTALTGNLLGFARRGAMQTQSVVIRQLVEDTANLLRHTVPKTIEIRTAFEHDALCWWGDRDQLHQLIMNLCLNAVDAIGDRGELMVRTRRVRIDTRDDALALAPGDYVRLDVIDDGCGMDEHALAYAFEPFFTTKSVGQGTGLGLSMAHGTAHSHGGSIAIESVPERGTTVSVWIPAAAESVEQAPEPEPAKAPVPVPVRVRVLLVEDEGTIRMAASELLQRLGYEVVEAADGEQALDRFHAHAGQFAVVLLDLMMPRVDGTTAFHALRREDPQLPIVLMSGHSKSGAVSRLRDAGAVEFLPKPFSSRDLAAAVEQAIARRSAAS